MEELIVPYVCQYNIPKNFTGKLKSSDGLQYGSAVDGLLHSGQGPAVVNIYGHMEWYQYGKLHREDGPAVVYPSSIGNQFFLFGKYLNYSAHTALVQRIRFLEGVIPELIQYLEKYACFKSLELVLLENFENFKFLVHSTHYTPIKKEFYEIPIEVVYPKVPNFDCYYSD